MPGMFNAFKSCTDSCSASCSNTAAAIGKNIDITGDGVFNIDDISALGQKANAARTNIVKWIDAMLLNLLISLTVLKLYEEGTKPPNPETVDFLNRAISAIHLVNLVMEGGSNFANMVLNNLQKPTNFLAVEANLLTADNFLETLKSRVVKINQQLTIITGRPFEINPEIFSTAEAALAKMRATYEITKLVVEAVNTQEVPTTLPDPKSLIVTVPVPQVAGHTIAVSATAIAPAVSTVVTSVQGSRTAATATTAGLDQFAIGNAPATSNANSVPPTPPVSAASGLDQSAIAANRPPM